jgi:hypothetical protein
LKNGRSIVCYGDVAIGRNEDLVEAAGTQGSFDNVCDCSGSKDVRLDSFVTELPLFLALAERELAENQQEEFQMTYSRTTMNGLPCSSFITAATPN